MSEKRETCPKCGSVLTILRVTYSTVPVEAVTFCPDCPGEEAKWAEHYEGDILRFPKVDLDGAA